MRRYKKEELYFYLTENYSKKPKKDILNDLGLSWNYIQKKCHLFGIKRIFNESSHSYSLQKLLDFDNISCYWLGFLLADGHLGKREYLQVNLSRKDETHFLKIESHLKINISKYYNNDLDCVRFTLSDRPTLIEIKKIFNWSTNKTKNIPIIPDFLDNNQLFSLIIGFIDGDGTINKKGDNLTIKCDRRWKTILDFFYFKLTDDKKNFNYIDDCAIIYINKHSILKRIKEKSIKLNLPIMKRKWDRIDLNRILKQDKYNIVLNELNNGKTKNEIMKKYNFGETLIYRVIKEK